MSYARIAALHRELADAYEELDRAPEPARSKPRRTRTISAPPGEADEVTRARAKRLLHERGYRDVSK